MGELGAEVPEIRRLDEAVVNRIAAGEIIQRPASALKEMLENSLDAGATQIIVTVKDGGKSLLQIQDNGHGIRRGDLPILCERHTTSKLRAFEELEGIQTLGFRGEALASITYVAHLTVTTMTEGAVHGWRATYSDGVLDQAGPRPTAANRGTLISVEDLFWNVPLRKKALKGASEEYQHILDVMGRYAVYKAGVSMTCKRQGEARSDLHTLAGASRLDNIRAVFGAAVSKHVVPLQLVKGRGAGETGRGSNGQQQQQLGEGEEEGNVHCEVEGFVSNADYSGKRTQMVLFINGRSVECTPLKRAIEATYAAILPKAAKPFIFLEVRLPGSHVDVNVHPTKKEVGFLYQEELIEAIRLAVEEKLLGSNNKRTYAQALLPGASLVDMGAKEATPLYYRPDKLVRTDARAQTLHAFLGTSSSGSQAQAQAQAQAADQQQLQEQWRPGWLGTGSTGEGAVAVAMEEDLAGQGEQQQQGQQWGQVGKGQKQQQEWQQGTAPAATAAAAAAASAPAARRRTGAATRGSGAGSGMYDFMPTPMEIAGAPVGAQQAQQQAQQQGGSTQFAAPARQQRWNGGTGLDSIRGLLAEAESRPHAGLQDVLRSHTWVGLADATAALVQAGTRLYLLDVQRLSADMFYQQALRRFGAFPRICLQPPPPVEALVLAALETEEALGRWQDTPEGGTKQEVAALLVQLLRQKAGLLGDHWGIELTQDGCLASLPQLIEQYVPDLDRLPAFVLALGQSVEWGEEEACFRGLAQALAEFYSVQPSIADAAEAAECGGGGTVSSREGQGADEEMEAAAVAAAAGVNGASQEGEGGKQGMAAAAAGKGGATEQRRRQREWSVQHVVMPALRACLAPARQRATDGTVVELTRLEKLYRVFERC